MSEKVEKVCCVCGSKFKGNPLEENYCSLTCFMNRSEPQSPSAPRSEEFTSEEVEKMALRMRNFLGDEPKQGTVFEVLAKFVLSEIARAREEGRLTAIHNQPLNEQEHTIIELTSQLQSERTRVEALVAIRDNLSKKLLETVTEYDKERTRAEGLLVYMEKISKPALGGKFQQALAKEALGKYGRK